MLPGKTEVKQGRFIEFKSPTKGYFRETCEPQNINPISLTPKFTFGVIQIIIKACQLFLVLISIKNTLFVQFQYLTFPMDPEVRSMCKVRDSASILMYTSFPLN